MLIENRIPLTFEKDAAIRSENFVHLSFRKLGYRFQLLPSVRFCILVLTDMSIYARIQLNYQTMELNLVSVAFAISDVIAFIIITVRYRARNAVDLLKLGFFLSGIVMSSSEL